MSRPFEIVALDRIETTHRFQYEDRYSFQPSKGYVRLQKLCFWVLRKLCCMAWDEKIEFRKQRIDTDRVVEAILKQREVAERIGPDAAATVYMGPEDYQRLVGDEWVAGRIGFVGEARYGRVGPNGPHITIFNLRIEMVPWMSGILVV